MEISASLSLSAAAAAHIKKVAAENGNVAPMIRLEVASGGCSGFSYKFGFASASDAAEDVVVSRDGATLVIDKTSLGLLEGSEIDYSTSLMESGFRVTNPNAVASCGCGTSFAIKTASPDPH